MLCVKLSENAVCASVCKPIINAVCDAVCEPIRNATCYAVCEHVGNAVCDAVSKDIRKCCVCVSLQGDTLIMGQEKMNLANLLWL